jgi:hypothetical protein
VVQLLCPPPCRPNRPRQLNQLNLPMRPQSTPTALGHTHTSINHTCLPTPTRDTFHKGSQSIYRPVLCLTHHTIARRSNGNSHIKDQFIHSNKLRRNQQKLSNSVTRILATPLISNVMCILYYVRFYQSRDGPRTLTMRERVTSFASSLDVCHVYVTKRVQPNTHVDRKRAI